MGHDIGLALEYVKPSVEEMYQEYQNAFDNLTINSTKDRNTRDRKRDTGNIEGRYHVTAWHYVFKLTYNGSNSMQGIVIQTKAPRMGGPTRIRVRCRRNTMLNKL